MYNLNIQAFGNPSPFRFKFDTKEKVFAAAQRAMDDGYYRAENIAVVLGSGSILNITSDEGDVRASKAAEEAERSGGLIQDGRFEVKPEDFVLHIQMGMAQLPPLTFKTEAERKAVIDEVLHRKRLHYVFEQDHDHLFVMVGSGVTFVSLSGEKYIENRRAAIAQAQRMRAAQVAQQQPRKEDPKIFLPFSRK